MSNLLWFLKSTRQALKYGIVSVVLGGAVTGVTLVMPQLFGRLIDSGLVARNASALMSSTIMLGCGGAVMLVLSQAQSLIMHRYKTTGNKLLATFVYGKILNCPYSDFIENKPGQIARTLGEILGLLSAADIAEIGQFLTSLVKAAAVLVMLTLMSWQLTVVAAGLVLVDLLSTWLYEKMQLRQRQAERSVEAESSGGTVEAFQSIQLIKSCQAEEHELNVYARWRDKVVELSNRRFRLSAVMTFVRSALSAGNKLVLLVLGGIWFLKHASTSLGDLTIFIAYAGQLSSGVRDIGRKAMQWRESFIVLDVLRRVTNAQAARKSDNQPQSGLPGEDETVLAMQDVSFGYPSGKGDLVIRHAELRLKAGKTTGIVGPTGDGKSTLCHLLAGLYEPSGGTIRRYRPPDHHGCDKRVFLGLVPQEVALMGRSIRENVTYHCESSDGITDQRILTVLEACQMREMVEALPLKLETQLLDRQNALSGGQRQRLAIARELLARPRVLVLDEATSGLDLDTERKVMQGIREMLPDVAIVFVSHRKEMFRFCDEVYCLSDGTIRRMEDPTEVCVSEVTGNMR